MFLKLGNELSIANRCVNIRLSNNIEKIHLEIEIVNFSNIQILYKYIDIHNLSMNFFFL